MELNMPMKLYERGKKQGMLSTRYFTCGYTQHTPYDAPPDP